MDLYFGNLYISVPKEFLDVSQNFLYVFASMVVGMSKHLTECDNYLDSKL